MTQGTDDKSRSSDSGGERFLPGAQGGAQSRGATPLGRRRTSDHLAVKLGFLTHKHGKKSHLYVHCPGTEMQHVFQSRLWATNHDPISGACDVNDHAFAERPSKAGVPTVPF